MASMKLLEYAWNVPVFVRVYIVFYRTEYIVLYFESQAKLPYGQLLERQNLWF